MPNNDGKITRMNFFDGLFLTQEEFNVEQQYHMQMRRQHNAHFHGTGIIEGLEVVAGEVGKLIVTKGAAINRVEDDGISRKTGEEIILTQDETVSIYEGDITTGYSGDFYVCIKYAAFKDQIDPDKGGENEIHWLEHPLITCKIFNPTPSDPDDDIEEIVLAKVNINTAGEVLNIDDSCRIYAGFVGNQVTTGELTVTNNGAIGNDLTVTNNATIGNNLTVQGDLHVQGEFDKELVTKDDIITLNKGDNGPTSGLSGIEVFRTSPNQAQLLWDETTGRWKAGIFGTVHNIVYGPNLNVDLQTGNVGIGKAASAGAKLGVGGDVAIDGAATVGANLTVKGNLTVEGVFEQELTTRDDILILNKGAINPTSKISGLEIFRGGADPARLVWDEVDGQWKIGTKASMMPLVTTNQLSTGVSKDIYQVEHNLKPGQALYFNGKTERYELALSSDEITAGLFIVSAIIDKNNFTLVQAGYISDLEIGGLIPGEYYYVSDQNPGELTGLEPAGISNPIFFADSKSSGYVLPYRPSALTQIPEFSGMSRDILQVKHGFKPGMALYFDGETQRYELALSSNEITVGLFLVSRVIDNDNFTLVQAGFVDGLEIEGLTPGEYYYVSDQHAGELTALEPATISNPILFADSKTSGYVLPYRPSALAQIPEFSGMSKDIHQVEHDFKPGMALYFSPETKRYELALSNNEYTVGLFVVSRVIDTNNFTLVQAGYVEGLGGLIPGEYYYVSDKNPGEMAPNEPAGISNPIFFADSETSGYVLPYRPSDLSQIPVSPWTEDTNGNIAFKGYVGIGDPSGIKLPDRLLHLGRHNEGGSLRIEGSVDGSGQAAISVGGEGEVAVDGYDYPKGRFVIQQNGNVGIGVPAPKYKLQVNGISYALSHESAGVDYAEYFESANGKAIAPGTAVVLEKGRIRSAKKNETPIGIISANPVIVGGVHPEWPHKYVRDAFGAVVMEKVKEEILVVKKTKMKEERHKVEKKSVREKVARTQIVLKNKKYCQVQTTETMEREIETPLYQEVDLYDDKGKKVIGRQRVPVMESYEEEIEVYDDQGRPVMVGSGKFETKERPKINPKYNPAKEYVPREQRPEWNCVGLLGQIPLRKGQPVAPGWVMIKNITKDVELWLVK